LNHDPIFEEKYYEYTSDAASIDPTKWDLTGTCTGWGPIEKAPVNRRGTSPDYRYLKSAPTFGSGHAITKQTFKYAQLHVEAVAFTNYTAGSSGQIMGFWKDSNNYAIVRQNTSGYLVFETKSGSDIETTDNNNIYVNYLGYSVYRMEDIDIIWTKDVVLYYINGQLQAMHHISLNVDCSVALFFTQYYYIEKIQVFDLMYEPDYRWLLPSSLDRNTDSNFHNIMIMIEAMRYDAMYLYHEIEKSKLLDTSFIWSYDINVGREVSPFVGSTSQPISKMIELIGMQPSPFFFENSMPTNGLIYLIIKQYMETLSNITTVNYLIGRIALDQEIPLSQVRVVDGYLDAGTYGHFTVSWQTDNTKLRSTIDTSQRLLRDFAIKYSTLGTICDYASFLLEDELPQSEVWNITIT